MEQLPPSVVCFGEVLWDILPSGALPGGAPMNVAYHLKKLGVQPALITKIGSDDYGKKLLTTLTKSGLTTRYVDVDAEHVTGLVYANINDHQEVKYDIINPAAWDFIALKKEYRSVVQTADYFVFGSLGSRNKVSAYTLEELLKEAKIKVLDINLRPPHFNPTQIEQLLHQTDILKLNTAELELISSWFCNYTDSTEQINYIQDKFNIFTLIVTGGGAGALVNERGKFYSHPGFKITVADTIGSGDAFLAGYLFKLIQKASVAEALTFSCGIGAFIATRSGACPPYHTTDITALIQSASNEILM